MAKVYSNQLTVRVWRNIKTLGGLPSSHFGHASLTMSGMFLPGSPEDGRRRVQISFWPAESAGIGMSGIRKQGGLTSDYSYEDKVSEMNRLTALRLEVGYRDDNGIPVPKSWRTRLANYGKTPLSTPRDGQRRLGFTSEGTDSNDENDLGWPLWSQSPEVKVPLPGFMVKGRLWGLSIPRINRWWTTFKAQAPQYQALSRQNCAGVVLMALKEGGAEAFVAAPSVHVYAEPIQVEQYARLLEMQLERYETWSADLDTQIRSALAAGTITPAMLSGSEDGLWTVERWKGLSSLGPLQPRSSVIRAIDDALVRYHAAEWKVGYLQKYKALSDVFLNVCIHRQQKPKSERSAAVLGLGLQVLAYLRAPGPYLS